MNIVDILRSAVTNSFRNRTRTLLTVLAIFIGAFTLTLTSAVGAGINDYIDQTIASIGADDVMTVSKTQEAVGDGPREYQEGSSTVEADGPPGTTAVTMSDADITAIGDVSGVESVEPVLSVSPDYIRAGDATVAGTQKFEVNVGADLGTEVPVLSGRAPSSTSSGALELVLPESFVDALGFSSDDAAVGQSVSLGVTDATGASSEIVATVVGIAEPGLVTGTAANANDALTTALYDAQNTGLPASAVESYTQASVTFDPTTSADAAAEVKAALADAGYTGRTVADQIGTFTTAIDAIVLVLNAFAVIALLAAGLGIVNTLLMSVQERTREIGLMKAMGMAGSRIFGMFTAEAVFIGLLGSAIGAGVAMALGAVANAVLAGGLLSALPGLSIVAFSWTSIGGIVLIVMGIAFLAGTIPALRAARQDPIESLRYE